MIDQSAELSSFGIHGSMSPLSAGHKFSACHTLGSNMSSAPNDVDDISSDLSKTPVSVAGRVERKVEKDGIVYKTYTSENQLEWITDLMKKDLSEPYSVYTYRYFINNWPDLCWLVRKCVLNKLYVKCCFFCLILIEGMGVGNV